MSIPFLVIASCAKPSSNHPEGSGIRRLSIPCLEAQGGAAFIMVLSAILVMMLMASGFTLMVRYEISQIASQRHKVRSFYTTEAGLEVATQRRSFMPLEHCYDTVTEIGSFDFPAAGGLINAGDKKQGTVTGIECWYLDADTLTRQPGQDTNNDGVIDPTFQPDDREVIELVSHGESIDPTEGFAYKGGQSWFIRSPFSKAIWATGNLHFESNFPVGWCLVTFSLWCADDMWSITGKVFAKKRPVDDWENVCAPFNWFDKCRKYWLVGWRCCLLLKGCSEGETCCCGFSKDMGARYAVRKKTGDSFHVCGNAGSPDGIDSGTKAYGGDCNMSGTDDEAEGEAGGGAAGEGWYFVRQQPTEEPFPQFSPPPDPRLPGANTGLTWMTGPSASNFLKTNGYLMDVWIDGDLEINWGWFEFLGVNGVGLWGTVYVNGRVIYKGATFSRLKLYAYPGWTNCIPGDMPAALCPGNKPPDPDNCPAAPSGEKPIGCLPGTLIVNKGNLSIESTGTPDLGRVNIVLVEGNKLEISSFCGLRSWGVYYVGGPLVDHDSDPDTPPIRLGGDIYLRSNTRYGGLAEPLRVLACDWLPDAFDPLKEWVGQRHAEFHGAVIGNDVFFEGGDKWSSGDKIDPGATTECSAGSLNTRDDCPNFLNILDNPDLVLPLGFFSSIKAWNWRLLE